jgi:class 3 adenylate cyclase
MELQGSTGHSTPPSLESERKLVTILFADVSGFTALAEAMDPEDAREVVEVYFRRMMPIVVKYRGTIEKFIGDEIMAVFGAPVASENDAECALRAALEMLEEFFRFNSERSLDIGLHFGINTGLVIAGGLGARGGEQYVVTGVAEPSSRRPGRAIARRPGGVVLRPRAYPRRRLPGESA